MQRGSYLKISHLAGHRIRNRGNVAMKFVEVQIGTYFGGDDITHYEDDDARKKADSYSRQRSTGASSLRI